MIDGDLMVKNGDVAPWYNLVTKLTKSPPTQHRFPTTSTLETPNLFG